tara:strand:- start:234 stop:686 length:453 start_codon:yes stop_codon:yes gene_type:complete
MSNIKMTEQTRKAVNEVRPYQNYMIQKLRFDGYKPRKNLPSLILQFAEIYGEEFDYIMENNPDGFSLKKVWKKVKKGAAELFKYSGVAGIRITDKREKEKKEKNSEASNNIDLDATILPPPPESTKSNTKKYLIAGGVGLVLIGLIIKFK